MINNSMNNQSVFFFDVYRAILVLAMKSRSSTCKGDYARIADWSRRVQKAIDDHESSPGFFVTRDVYRSIITILMCDNPSQLLPNTRKIVEDWANSSAQVFGYVDWVDAYHKL